MIAMSHSFDLQRQLSRFRRLPASNDTWEMAIVDMPMWVDGGPNGEPYAFDALPDWHDTPGALEWLRVETRNSR